MFRQLGNMRIVTKISILITITLLLMGLVVWIGVTQIRSIGGELRTLAQENVPLVEELNKITFHMLEQEKHLDRAIYLGRRIALDAESKRLFEIERKNAVFHGDEVSRGLNKIRQIIAHMSLKYQKVGVDDTVLRMDYELRNINKQHAEFQFKAERIFNLLSQSKLKEAERPIQEITEQYGHDEEHLEMERPLVKFTHVVKAFVNESALITKDSEREAVTAMISVSAAILIFCILLGIYVSRSITNPLNAAVDLAQKIESGSRDIDIKEIGKDETGQLLETLKSMFLSITKAEKDLKETNVQLVQSEKLSALGELTAGIAHELNQPLNGIKIIAQSMLRDIQRGHYVQDYTEQDLRDIVSQVNKMAEIIDHMRIFTRRSEGDVKEIVNINPLIDGVFKFLGQQLTNHNIEVIKELKDDLPYVEGNAIQLEQVFLNLITNARGALDSADTNNKTINIKSYVTSSQPSENGEPCVVVEVSDNGVGIPDDVKSKIFQPFYTTKEAGKGTGLGLSVSSKIIEEHKGKIELSSQVGKGTSFKILLPSKSE